MILIIAVFYYPHPLRSGLVGFGIGGAKYLKYVGCAFFWDVAQGSFRLTFGGGFVIIYGVSRRMGRGFWQAFPD